MTESLRQRLARSGVALTESETPVAIEPPWFVRALQAFSGWLAALFLLGFIGMGMVFVLESGVADAVLGLVLVAGAYALLRGNGGDFVEHLALAASLAGQLLLAWALVDALGGDTGGLWWVLLLLQLLLALAMPSLTHRALSASAASLALYMALSESLSAAPVAGGLVLLAAMALWLNELRWPARVRQCQALGYGLLLGLLAIQAMAYADQSPLMVRHQEGVVLTWLTPWMGDALATLALLLLMRHIFQREAHAVSHRVRIAAYGAALVVMLLSLQAHGLSQAVVVVMLGFAIAHRLIIALGVLLLLMAITNYYYWLEVTLLTKSATLLALGVLLLALRWGLQRWWRQGEGEVAR